MYQPLVKAIENYLAKAEESLADILKKEGYIKSKKTLKYIESIEEEITKALLEQRDDILEKLEKSLDIKTFVGELWESIKENDVLKLQIAAIFQDKLQKFVPEFVNYYIQQTDRQLQLKQVSQKTLSWIDSWSKELGEIMQLNSHKEIEAILKKGLEQGSGIPVITHEIMESGIRNEYYKARRVAVTEILTAHRAAQQEAFMQSPAVKEKKWKHTGSYRNQARQNHIDRNGQKVPKQEPYTLLGADGKTYYPMYPGDPCLPAKERIHCHCLSQSIIDETILGLSLEERQELQKKAVQQMDDKWKKEQENKVDFIQIADIENVPKQTIEAIRRDFDLIPEKHKQMMKGYVKEIKVREEKNPQYHREDRIIYVSKDYTKGEVLHEFAHGIETKFAFHKDPNYIKVLNHGLENIGIGDIIYDEETFIFPIYRLENSKFISEYQGRLYEEDLNGNGRFDNKAGTLNALCLGEYFSEGYKEYFINSEHLKLKDNMLYQFIKEL